MRQAHPLSHTVHKKSASFTVYTPMTLGGIECLIVLIRSRHWKYFYDRQICSDNNAAENPTHRQSAVYRIDLWSIES